MENKLQMHLIEKRSNMKLLSTVTVCVGLLTGISAKAQDVHKKEVTKFTPPVIVKNDQPDVTFKKRNKKVKSVEWEAGNVIIITKKDGTVERYRLDNDVELKKAESLYGELPVAPPPPPPAPGTPPPPPPPVEN